LQSAVLRVVFFFRGRCPVSRCCWYDLQHPGVGIFPGGFSWAFLLSSLSSKRHQLYNSLSQNIPLLLLLLPGRPGIGTPAHLLPAGPVFLCNVLHEHDKAVAVRDQVVEPSKIPVLIISILIRVFSKSSSLLPVQRPC
jgi:hypothetical protein